jgi:hypothetical protein
MGEWRFEPPPASDEIFEHFEDLLQRFERSAKAGGLPIQLIPVLLDFHFCEAGIRPVEAFDPDNPLRARVDPGWVKQGRGDAVCDPIKRSRFLDQVLERFLRVSAGHRDVIYAWDLMNEPEWITRGWHPDPSAEPPIPEEAMRDFLEDGKQRIRTAGFKPTIGFGSARALQRSGVTAEINQFHYYPNGRTRLQPHAFDPRFPGIIGEFATSTSEAWPELAASVQGVGHRLQLAEDRGYPLALLWSFLAMDRQTNWSAEVEADVREFTHAV